MKLSPDGRWTWPRTLIAGLAAALLTVTVTGCNAGGSIHEINNTANPPIIYGANPDPAVPGGVPLGLVLPTTEATSTSTSTKAASDTRSKHFDGSASIARRERPTCVSDTWTINHP